MFMAHSAMAPPGNKTASHRVEPAEMDRIAFAAEQRGRFIKRQADHVGIGADQLDDERAGKPLDGVAAGLAAPLTGRQIGLQVLLGEALEAYAAFDQALAKCLLRRD